MEIALTIICSIIGTIVAVITFQKSRDKDIRTNSRSEAVVSTKLDYIQRGVDDIRLDIKAQDRKITEMNEKLIKVEESAKSAHKRLDSIEEKGSN